MNKPKKEVVRGVLSKKGSLTLKQKRQELLHYLEILRNYKAKTIRLVNDLELKYYNKEISEAEFYYKLYQSLKGKKLEEWIHYYDNLISCYNNKLISLDEELKYSESTGINARTLLIVLMFIIIGISAIIFFKPGITGLIVYSPGEIVNETLTLPIPSDIIINESIVLVRLNAQEANLSLTEFNILENLTTIELNKFNIIAEDGTLITQIIYNNSIIVEISLLIELKQIVLEEIIINETIKTPEIIKKNITIIENITSLNLTEVDILKQRIEKEDLIIKDIKLAGNKHKIDIEFDKGKLEINGLRNINELKEIKTGKLSKNKIPDGLINTEIIAVNTIMMDNATITLPKNDRVNAIVKCDNFDFNNFNCNNWVKTNLDFLDNGTHIIFTVDSFSAYAGGYIEIIKAQHLDSNKNLISNIYNEVKLLDNVWSEIIPSGDYVKVMFEINLTSEKDITIYPRVVNGNPKIEVYENNQGNLLAEFTSINSNQYNKVCK